MSQVAEDDGEDDHIDDRLDDGPGGSQRGLLVAHFDVTPGQDVEQVAVAPQVAQVERNRPPRGLDHDRRRRVVLVVALRWAACCGDVLCGRLLLHCHRCSASFVWCRVALRPPGLRLAWQSTTLRCGAGPLRSWCAP